jgi:pSer/pThr/pTyr-binding forkhead associated (FHA) protein
MKQHPLQTFLDACGAQAPLKLEVAPTEAGATKHRVLHQPFALLGRHERADVHLPGPEVSRRHALVQVIAGRTFCVDLCSRTGTHWDSGSDHGWLPGGASLCVGPYRVHLMQPPSDAVALPPDTWNPLARGSHQRYALPTVTLNILNSGMTAYRWPMSRVLAFVGRSEFCKVRLHGKGVARHHCALVGTPLGVWVVDLQRRDGILVNETHVGHALLEEGDRLQVGSFTLCIEYDARPEPLAALPAENATLQSDDPAAADLPISTSLVAADFSPPGALRPLPGAGLVAAPTQVANVPAESWSPDLVAGLLRQFGEMQQQMFEQSLTMMFQMFRTMHTEQVGTLRQEMARLEELNRELNSLLSVRANGAPSLAPPLTPPALRLPAAASTSVPRPTSPTPTPEKLIPAAQPSAADGPDLHVWLCQRMEAIQQERQGLWDRIVGLVGKKD